MFYKPKFCCNCGEKIERADWRLFTSRRFCDVCEIEYKGNELIPRVIVGVAVFFGIFGIGSYFQARSTDLNRGRRIDSEASGSKKDFVAQSQRQPMPSNTGSSGLEPAKNQSQDADPKSEGSVIAASKEQPKIRKTASDEPVYFCGAMTKKGKPCSRRVKSSGERCWQHVGSRRHCQRVKFPMFISF